MIPDPFAKKVKIPIRVVDGKIQFFYGGKLPQLKEGAVGDLIISAFAIQDERQLNALNCERVEEILPKESCLLAEMRAINPSPLDSNKLLTFDDVRKGYGGVPYPFQKPSLYFAEIDLLDPLKIRLRSTKDACLENCKCH